jgi:hypothetical protein
MYGIVDMYCCGMLGMHGTVYMHIYIYIYIYRSDSVGSIIYTNAS